MRILDFHNHIGAGANEFVQQTADQLVSVMASYEIEKAVVFPFYADGDTESYRAENDYIQSAAERYPQLIKFARLHPAHQEKALFELTRTYQLGFRGIKLHTQSDRFTVAQVEPIARQAAQYEMPILIHFWDNVTQPWYYLFKEFPQTIFVLAHTAGKVHAPLAIKLASLLPNVYIETSTTFFSLMKYLLSMLPAEKAIYGSDSPFSHPHLEMELIKLTASTTQRKLIFYDNAARLLGL